MNEIKRLEHVYAHHHQEAKAKAIADQRLVFVLPEICIKARSEIAHLRRVQGTRRGTSMQAHRLLRKA